MLGETNTPEFGAGSQTFNWVFGVTRNPYDLSKTCGGSNDGAAVSVACRMLPIADGMTWEVRSGIRQINAMLSVFAHLWDVFRLGRMNPGGTAL